MPPAELDFARRFPGVVKAIRELPDDTLIDGEIVALDREGRPSFNLPQGFGAPAETVVYAFDLLMLRRRDVRLWSLEDRRIELQKLTTHLANTIRFSETFNVTLQDLTRAVRENQLEGIVAKRSGSPYRSGERSPDWVKWRANRGQEFVIRGYVAGGTSVESILVGYYRGRDLLYAAHVHAGMGQLRRVLLPFLEELQVPHCLFVNLPDCTEGCWGRRICPCAFFLPRSLLSVPSWVKVDTA